MYGLEIKTKNKYGKFIYTLLKNAGAERYVWQINSDDILTKNGHGLLHAKWVNGQTFADSIQKDVYYLIFADCKAFKNQDESAKILNGADMVKSACDLVFLCTDSVNIEIYCKDKSVYDTVKLNCKNDGIVSVRDIKEEEIQNRSLVAF